MKMDLENLLGKTTLDADAKKKAELVEYGKEYE